VPDIEALNRHAAVRMLLPAVAWPIVGKRKR